MIEIAFDNQTAEYRPGEMISGQVSGNDLQREKREIKTRLIWFTNQQRHHKTIAHQQTMAVSASGYRAFKFPAPIGPFSFKGKLFSIYWAIEVELENETFTEPLTISLTGKKIVLNKSFEKGKLQPLKKELKPN